MIKRFAGINISSADPKSLAHFYEKLGVPILTENLAADNYDGVEMGFDVRKPIIWIWDKAKWGKSNEGPVTLVFNSEDLDKTYEAFRRKGIVCDPPFIAVWGGKELKLKDIDGNTIHIME